MSIFQKIRLGAAIVWLCAICLPLSQCAHLGNNEQTPKAFAHSRHFFPRSDNDFEYQYAIKEIGFSLGGALALIAFVWPLGVAIWSQKSRLRRFWWMFYTAELLLCAGTGYLVYCLALGTSARWLYGFYVAQGAIAIYAITTLIFIFHRLRNLFVRRRAKEMIEA